MNKVSKNCSNQNGISLMELIVTTGLLGVVSLVTINLLSTGLKIQDFQNERILSKSNFENQLQLSVRNSLGCDYALKGKIIVGNVDGTFSMKEDYNYQFYADVELLPVDTTTSSTIPPLSTTVNSTSTSPSDTIDASASDSGDSTTSSSTADTADTSSAEVIPAVTIDQAYLDSIFSRGELIAQNYSNFGNDIKIQDISVSDLTKINETLFFAEINFAFKDKKNKDTRGMKIAQLIRANEDPSNLGEFKVESCVRKGKKNGEDNSIVPTDSEKIPPLELELAYSDSVRWACQQLNLEDHCADRDGCTIEARMQHEQETDQVRVYSTTLYLEETEPGGFSNNTAAGIYGWSTWDSGTTTAFILDRNSRYGDIFHPWNWFFIQNYEHQRCWVPNPLDQETYNTGNSPSQGATRGSPSGSFRGDQKYIVNILLHPHVKLRLKLYD